MAREPLKLVRVHPNAILPERKTRLSSGYDLAIPEDVLIHPRQTTVIKTGWKLGSELPTVELAVVGPAGPEVVGSMAMLIIPRSSLSLKHGLIVPNSPGLVDADYTEEIGILVHNLTDIPVMLAAGTRIAQFVLVYFDMFGVIEVQTASQTTERSGFGSTGV